MITITQNFINTLEYLLTTLFLLIAISSNQHHNPYNFNNKFVDGLQTSSISAPQNSIQMVSSRHLNLPKLHWSLIHHSHIQYSLFDSEQFSVDGSIIRSLTELDLRQEMHIKSNITIKKLMSCIENYNLGINFGINEYETYLNQYGLSQGQGQSQNTEIWKGNSTIQAHDNAPKFHKNGDIVNEFKTNDVEKQTLEHKTKIQMVIKQEEIEHDNVIYRLGVDGADIGRHTSNKILILDQAVSRYHSKITYQGGMFVIRDIGSTTGTFIKLQKMKKLELGNLIEIGSYTFLVRQIEGLNLIMEVIEGSEQPYMVQIQIDKRITIGRKASNKISFPEDAHMSNTHACIFSIKSSLYIEDLQATNGTWIRLSSQGQPSNPYPLVDGDFFKISGGCTYSVRTNHGRKQEKQIPSYCIKCAVEEKNVVLLPCKHNVVCLGCSERLKECPHCKQEIEERLKIFG